VRPTAGRRPRGRAHVTAARAVISGIRRKHHHYTLADGARLVKQKSDFCTLRFDPNRGAARREEKSVPCGFNNTKFHLRAKKGAHPLGWRRARCNPVMMSRFLSARMTEAARECEKF
jgi:hypothetical protein